LFGFVSLPAFAASDTVAVLPFFNQAHNPSLDWIGESAAETLRESLSSSGVLALPREERVEVYQRLAVRSNALLTHATIIRIGESLDAGKVVYGSYELAPDAADSKARGTLKITANVIDIKRMKAGPQIFQAGPLENLSLLQSQLSWQFIKYFLPKSAPEETDYLKKRPPVRVEAVESYIRGLLAGGSDQREKLFLQASRLDPKFSDPAFQLGEMAFERKDYRGAIGWLEKVDSATSHFHEAEFLLGLCHYYTANYDKAVELFQKLAADVPLNEVFNDLGAALSRRNKPDAMDNFRKALEGDEADPDYWFNVGYASWKAGKTADAANNFREVLARTPDDREAQALYARAHRGEGPRAGEALNGERVKTTFEETVLLQLQAELKK
jgi:tetratricopeptide (TPR) repeat protein